MKSKVFLSHSSHDKEYVRFIADELGKDLCVFDEYCFEAGMKTLDEIMKGMDQTSIFVFFISNSSLDSDWVKREVFEAENRVWDSKSRISQIFPIIIDSTVTYKDKRIPPFLTNRYAAYNIQHIKSNRVAARKILSQYKRNLLENGRTNIEAGYSDRLFYGRHNETSLFQDHFESGQRIQCLVVSGIQGIGKRSFIVHALRETGIIEKYYEPPVISMKNGDGIIDLIMRLIELGFGDRTYEEIVKISSTDEQINILSELLKEIQNSNEHVIIYDDRAILNYDGEIKYWLTKALSKVRAEMTISIAASIELRRTFLRDNKNFIGIGLTTLRKSEWKGLLREYGKHIGVELDAEDISNFSGCITGYPPQVIYCAELVCQEGLEYTKKHVESVVSAASDNIASVVSLAFKEREEKEKQIGQGFLAVLSNYGIMPMSLLHDIIGLNPLYKDFYHLFKSLTIVRLIGGNKDYIEVNPAVADFVQRTFSVENKDISLLLETKYNNFKEKMEHQETGDEDFESLRLFLKRTVIERYSYKGLVYSTIYLAAIQELYNNRKYGQVIDIVMELKERGAYDRFDIDIEEQFQRYLCRALARQMDRRFDEELEWYKKKMDEGHQYHVEFHFLCGFKWRLNGNYEKAVKEYQIVLGYSHNHRAAKRELMASYVGMEEYDMCLQYAEMYFNQDPSNIYYIQAFFDSLIHSEETRERDEKIKKVMNALEMLHSIGEKKDSIYYEIRSKYEFFIKRNEEEAFRILEEGEGENKESPYLVVAEFDLSEQKKDIGMMRNALGKIGEFVEKKDNNQTKLAYQRRCIIYKAFERVDVSLLDMEIDSLQGVSDVVRKHLKNRIRSIASHTSLTPGESS